MTDEKMPRDVDRELRRALAGFRKPPEPDTDRLWARIVASRNLPGGVRKPWPRRRALSVVMASASIAAALAVAVFKNQPERVPAVSTTAKSGVVAPVRHQSGRAATAVAMDHVKEAETVLQALATADRGTTPAKARLLVHSAQTLLVGTRVVRGAEALSSELDGILKDFELVLTQLAAADRDTSEIQFAAQTARTRDLLRRMQRLQSGAESE